MGASILSSGVAVVQKNTIEPPIPVEITDAGLHASSETLIVGNVRAPRLPPGSATR